MIVAQLIPVELSTSEALAIQKPDVIIDFRLRVDQTASALRMMRPNTTASTKTPHPKVT